MFLTESRSAPLYHATGFNNLRSIVNEGIRATVTHEDYMLLKAPIIKVRPDVFSNQRSYQIASIHTRKPNWWTYVKGIRGVSLTRSFKKAQRLYSDIHHDGVHPSNKAPSTIILELDQTQLTHKYKITPIRFYANDPKNVDKNNEYEEFVETKTAIPFKYISRIWIKSEHSKLSIVRDLAQKYGRDFIRIYE